MLKTQYLLSSDYFPFGGKSLYNWEGLYMQLDCDMEVMPLNEDSNTTSTERKEDIIIFIHEYMHYLQNFSTNWGVQIFVDINASYLKIAASHIDSKELLILPVNISSIQNKLLKDGFELRNIAIEKMIQYNTIEVTLNGSLIDIQFEIDYNRGMLILSNGLIKVDIGAKNMLGNYIRYQAGIRCSII